MDIPPSSFFFETSLGGPIFLMSKSLLVSEEAFLLSGSQTHPYRIVGTSKPLPASIIHHGENRLFCFQQEASKF